MSDLRDMVMAVRAELVQRDEIAEFDSVSIGYGFLPESILALYSPLWGYVMNRPALVINESLRFAAPGMLAGVLCHELHHVWQWRHQRGRYLAGKLWRPLIERSADEIEADADAITGNANLMSGD